VALWLNVPLIVAVLAGCPLLGGLVAVTLYRRVPRTSLFVLFAGIACGLGILIQLWPGVEAWEYRDTFLLTWGSATVIALISTALRVRAVQRAAA